MAERDGKPVKEQRHMPRRRLTLLTANTDIVSRVSGVHVNHYKMPILHQHHTSLVLPQLMSRALVDDLVLKKLHGYLGAPVYSR
jgi:hypothetical protein